MPERIHRINQLLQQELNDVIIREMEFAADSLVTITAVVTSQDLRHARVFVSVLPAHKAPSTIKLLRRARLERFLHKRLATKPLPRLHYVIDDTEAKAADTEALLDQIG